MEWTLATFGMKRARLMFRQQAHARSTGELLATARRLSRTAEELEIEIKQTGDDIRKVQKTYKRSSRKERRAA